MKTPTVANKLLAVSLIIVFAGPIYQAGAGLIAIESVSTGVMGELSEDYRKEYMINGAGLAGNQHSAQAVGVHWAGETIDGDVTFKLSSWATVESARIWNYNDNHVDDYTGWGAKDIDVLSSTDGVNFFAVQSITLAKAPGNSGYTGQVFDLPDFTATHVRFHINSNYGGGGSGLSEVQFSGTAVPEPSTLAALSGLLGMGLVGRWWRRRKG